MKTAKEFNKKWSNYLEDRFYGLEFSDEKVIKYLDKEFENEVKENPNFQYSQIKLKFGFSRVYAESDKTEEWENMIDEILKR